MNKLSCGTTSQPWVIEAPIGQHVNVSLLEFGIETAPRMKELPQRCERYGTVTEKTTGKTVFICGHGRERNTMVFKSQSNIIEVVLDVKNGEDVMEKPRILIGFHGRVLENVF